MAINNDCFCELAPLYALDLLSEEERGWIEQQISDCPDLAEELADYQVAVTAIPYEAPALPLASQIKNQLFDRLKLDPPHLQSHGKDAVPSSQAIRSQDLNWQSHPTPGVAIAIVHRDEVKRELVGFVRAEAGVHYPFHRHASSEEIFMLEGDLVIEEDIYGAGDYIRSSPGSSHAPYTRGGCRFFFHASLDDEYPTLIGVAGKQGQEKNTR